jgi:hypothetical protein
MSRRMLLAAVAGLLLAGCQRKDETSGMDRLIGGGDMSQLGAVASQRRPTTTENVVYGFQGVTTEGQRVKGTLTITPTATHPEGAPANIFTIPATIEFSIGKLKGRGLSVLDVGIQNGTLTFNEFSVSINGAHSLFALTMTFGENFDIENLSAQLIRLDAMGLVSSDFLINSYEGPPINIAGSLTRLKKGRSA